MLNHLIPSSKRRLGWDLFTKLKAMLSSDKYCLRFISIRPKVTKNISTILIFMVKWIRWKRLRITKRKDKLRLVTREKRMKKKGKLSEARIRSKSRHLSRNWKTLREELIQELTLIWMKLWALWSWGWTTLVFRIRLDRNNYSNRSKIKFYMIKKLQRNFKISKCLRVRSVEKLLSRSLFRIKESMSRYLSLRRTSQIQRSPYLQKKKRSHHPRRKRLLSRVYLLRSSRLRYIWISLSKRNYWIKFNLMMLWFKDYYVILQSNLMVSYIRKKHLHQAEDILTPSKSSSSIKKT